MFGFEKILLAKSDPKEVLPVNVIFLFLSFSYVVLKPMYVVLFRFDFISCIRYPLFSFFSVLLSTVLSFRFLSVNYLLLSPSISRSLLSFPLFQFSFLFPSISRSLFSFLLFNSPFHFPSISCSLCVSCLLLSSLSLLSLVLSLIFDWTVNTFKVLKRKKRKKIL